MNAIITTFLTTVSVIATIICWFTIDPVSIPISKISDKLSQNLPEQVITNYKITVADLSVEDNNKGGLYIWGKVDIDCKSVEPSQNENVNYIITAKPKKTKSVKELNIGDRIRLDNGKRGIYYGVYHLHYYNLGHESKRRFILKLDDGTFFAMANFKIKEVFDTVSLSKEDALSELKEKNKIDETNWYMSQGYTLIHDKKVDLKKYEVATIEEISSGKPSAYTYEKQSAIIYNRNYKVKLDSGKLSFEYNSNNYGGHWNSYRTPTIVKNYKITLSFPNNDGLQIKDFVLK